MKSFRMFRQALQLPSSGRMCVEGGLGNPYAALAAGFDCLITITNLFL